MNNKLYNTYLNSICEIPDFLEKYLSLPALVRLKSVGYFCGMDYASKAIYDFKEKISRYDHSLTVALITWKFTRDKAMTISALLHDIATPCFAHVIDYMNQDYANQESTEEYTERIICHDKTLEKILEKDQIKAEDIADFKKFPIIDNKRPKMCADRFDGIILTGIAWTKTIAKEDIKELVSDLAVFINEDGEEELGFQTKETALKALHTSEMIDKFCHSSEDNYMMELLALLTRKTIENEVIHYDDLYELEEPQLLEKIRKSNIKELQELLDRFENISLAEIPETKLEGVKARKLSPIVANKRI